jgi:hypothetical protein
VAGFAFYFTACRKDALDYSTFTTTPDVVAPNPIDRVLKDKFFQTPTNLHPEFQLLIENLKKQDSLKNFITQAWIQKNGLPVWDKTFSNFDDGSQTSFGSAGRDFNLYFTPLKSGQSDKIQSYIVSYQNDTAQYHRLYNYDELVKIDIAKKDIREEVTGILSVFSYFERTINNKNSITIGQPFNVSFDNTVMSFGGKSNTQLQSRSACYEISVSWGLQAAMGWGYSSGPVCWDALTSYQELTWSTGVSNGPSASGWPSSGTGGGGGTSWGGTSFATLNISDLISVLIGEIPLQQILKQYPNDATFINFVVNLKKSGQVITLDYAELLYASYSKYTQAGFSESELAAICKNQVLFTEINEAANEEMGEGFREDALLYQKLMSESAEFLAASNSLNTLSTGGGGSSSVLSEILTDLLIEGAQEVAGDFTGLTDIQAIRDLVQKGTDKGLKIAYKVFRRSVKFLAGRNPLVRAYFTIEKVNNVFQKFNKVKNVYEKLHNLNIKVLEGITKALKNSGGKLLSRIEDTYDPTMGSTLSGHFDIKMDGELVDVFVDKIGNALGIPWVNRTGGARTLDLSSFGVRTCVFYPLSTTPPPSPTIQIILTNGKEFKFRLRS